MDSFKDMIKAVSNFGPRYKAPSYTTLQTKLVASSRKDVGEYVAEIKSSWAVQGCSIMSDMWTDLSQRSYINVVAYSPKGAVFLNSFERSADKKTGTFLRDILVSVIDEIGAENVIQVITDNASNYGLAGVLIMDRYPHIYKTRCSAHGVQLLVKDIYEQIPWVKKVFDDAKAIVDYMYKHTNILSLMRDFCDKELKKFSKTRFASHFLLIQSIIDAEEEIIRNDEFWKEAKEIVVFFEPLIRVLRLVDGDGSTAGYLYEAVEKTRTTWKLCCQRNPEKHSRILELFEDRWTLNMLNVVHAAACYLNPSLMYDKKFRYDNADVRDGLLFIEEKLLEPGERADFANQLLEYDSKNPEIFNFMSLTQMKSAHPRVWWEANGGSMPILQKVAIKILSQPCNASSCERNWRAFDAAQTKKRNRLLPEMLETR
ncbi:hypothetical protein GIB67_023320 [Kingdonia uniflora]|uniref:Uncharacterized protein n=1 Tax=Kingdonia uniflora TaxID=39325 RepID=A0A7J7NE34_9MAGN|nr:hypothetical protein GIB67_023320 [Kingdonia uniflora]